MVTSILARVATGGGLRLRRAAAVTERNVVAFRHAMYWWLIISGIAEPLLYLLTIGWGVGTLIGEVTLPDGRAVPYVTFLAPAMVAAAAMNGALTETVFNFFAKMKYAKLYQSVLNTPVTPTEVAFGEVGWAMMRGAIYTVAFLVALVVIDATTPVLALVAFPAALLVGFAFGGLGMTMSTFMRSWQDFDFVATAQFALFLFSGTFVPVSAYPAVLRVVVQATPLYHGVELLRGVTTGAFEWGMLWHVAYLVAVTGVGLTVAARRMTRLLCK